MSYAAREVTRWRLKLLGEQWDERIREEGRQTGDKPSAIAERYGLEWETVAYILRPERRKPRKAA